MRHFFSQLKMFVPLFLVLLSALPASGQNTLPPMTPAALREFRLYVDFSTSTYNGHPSEQEEVRRGIELGMRMWQSVLPGLDYQWVSDVSQANLVLKFGNYQSQAARDGTSCRSSMWTACARGQSGGVLTSNAMIWFNDAGKAVGGGAIAPFTFDQYTYVSRSQLLAGYQPATWPPVAYSASNPGHITGRFLPEALGASNDVSMIHFHEFAHVLGMGHHYLSDIELKGWYRRPSRVSDGFQPAQPYLHIAESMFPGLPPEYYNDYYGGGTYNPSTGQVIEEWVGNMDEVHPIMFNHHHGRTGTMPPGIPLPPIYNFNNRVVFPDDLSNAYLPAYSWSYPRINGIIILRRPSTGEYFYTSDWSEAIAKAQLNTAGQPGGWFVVDVVLGSILKQKLAAGYDHVLAVRDNGTVWAWGRNHVGQLGQGTTSTSPNSSPVPVTGLTGAFTSVAAGLAHSVALKADGTIWTWGSNSSGQLGNNTTQNRSTPVQVCNVTGQPCSGNRYIAIAAGGDHTLALREDGTLWSWGYNGEGQLGQNHSSPVYLPRMEYWGQNDWVSISAGHNHSLGIKSSGAANGWGYGHRGQNGTGNLGNVYYPSPDPTYTVWRDFAVGGSHSNLGRDMHGKLQAIGDNSAGQLGRNTSEFAYSAYPVQVQGEGLASGWAQIARGDQHSGGLKSDGRLWTWGSNTSGQLGRGAIASTAVPGQVSGNRTDWISLFMGTYHSFAFRKDGSLWAWGNNQYGQLGNGNTTSSNVPVVAKFGDAPSVALYADWTSLNPSQRLHAPDTRQVLLRLNSAGTAFVAARFDLKASAFGNLTQVEFRNGTTILGTDNTPPYGMTWSAPSAGRFTLTGRASDRMGGSATSPVLTLDVFQLGERSRTPPTNSVNLMTEGALDWMHWGLVGTGRIEKANTSLIQMQSSSTPATRFKSTSTSVPGFAWSNGTSKNPTIVDSSRTGVYLRAGEYLSFSIPSTTTLRTVQVWFRVRNAGLMTSAWLNNFPSSSMTKMFPGAFESTTRNLIYEITYRIPSGQDSMGFQLEPDFGSGGGELIVQAIALK